MGEKFVAVIRRDSAGLDWSIVLLEQNPIKDIPAAFLLGTPA